MSKAAATNRSVIDPWNALSRLGFTRRDDRVIRGPDCAVVLACTTPRTEGAAPDVATRVFSAVWTRATRARQTCSGSAHDHAFRTVRAPVRAVADTVTRGGPGPIFRARDWGSGVAWP